MDQERDNNRSSVDKANDAIQNAQATYNKYKKGRKALSGGRIAGRLALQGARSLATAAVSSTSPAWGTVAVVVIVIILLLVTIIVLFGGGAEELANQTNPPACQGITAAETSVGVGQSVQLSVQGCGADVTYSWVAATGTFSATGASTTSYTAPGTVPNPPAIAVSVNVCSQEGQCSLLTTTLAIEGGASQYTCLNNPSQYCGPSVCSFEGDKIGTGQCQVGRHCCKQSFVFYCQGDPDFQYGVCGRLGQCGCAPTSMAMILSSLGPVRTPDQIAKIFDQRNWGGYNENACSYRCGSNHIQTASATWLSSLGYIRGPNLVSGGRLNLTTANNYIKQGYLLYAAAGPWVTANGATLGGHQIVIQSVNPSAGTVYIRDPNCSTRENTSRNTRRASSINWWSVWPIKHR